MEFDEWVKHLEQNNLLFTEEEFRSLEPGKSYCFVEVDYLRFLAVEYANNYDIEFDTIKKPSEFYKRIKRHLVFNGEIKKQKSYYHGENSEVVHGYLNFYDAIMTDSGDTLEIGIYRGDNDPFLQSGSGDGYSRWISWDKLDQTPSFYIPITYNTDDE
jgi:hypothetical protein